MAGLDNEQWEVVNRHLTIALETMWEAGLSEEEAREEIDNAIENTMPSEKEYVPGPPKPKKPK